MVMRQLREFFHGGSEAPADTPQADAGASDSRSESETPPPTPPTDTAPPQPTPEPPAPEPAPAPAPSLPPPGTPNANDVLTMDKIRQMSASEINDHWNEIKPILEQGDR